VDAAASAHDTSPARSENIAAAAAIVALDNLVICMIGSQLLLNAAVLLLSYKDPATRRLLSMSKLMLSIEGAQRDSECP